MLTHNYIYENEEIREESGEQFPKLEYGQSESRRLKLRDTTAMHNFNIQK